MDRTSTYEGRQTGREEDFSYPSWAWHRHSCFTRRSQGSTDRFRVSIIHMDMGCSTTAFTNIISEQWLSKPSFQPQHPAAVPMVASSSSCAEVSSSDRVATQFCSGNDLADHSFFWIHLKCTTCVVTYLRRTTLTPGLCQRCGGAVAVSGVDVLLETNNQYTPKKIFGRIGW